MYTSYTKATTTNINTLKELDESGLRIVAVPTLGNTFGNLQTNSTLLKSLKQKLVFEYSESSLLDKVAEYRNVCSIERFSDVNILMKV